MNLPLFTNELPENVRGALVACATMRVYRAGEVLCRQNAPADAIYFVLSGTVQLVNADSGAQTILTPGDSFGESETVRGAAFQATAIAASDAQLWTIDKPSLDLLLSKYSALSIALSRLIVQKYEGTPLQQPFATVARPFAFGQAPALPSTRVRLVEFMRGMNFKRTLAILAGLLFVGIALPATALMLAATTIQVQGMQIDAPATDAPRLITSRARPTQVAQWIAPSESTPQRKPEARHTVVAGDTVGGIAQMHGATADIIRALNALDNPVIRVGDQLVVPGDEPPLLPATAMPTRTPRPLPTRIPVQLTPTIVPAAPIVLAAPTALPRLWQMPTWTNVAEANVAPGQRLYRLVRAVYFDEASAGGRVNILVAVLDENGKELADVPVKMEWGSGAEGYTVRKTESKRDPFLLPYNLDIVASHDMAGGSSFAPERGERGGYTITIEGTESDRVSGMGLPMKRHVAFLLVYQRTTK